MRMIIRKRDRRNERHSQLSDEVTKQGKRRVPALVSLRKSNKFHFILLLLLQWQERGDPPAKNNMKYEIWNMKDLLLEPRAMQCSAGDSYCKFSGKFRLDPFSAELRRQFAYCWLLSYALVSDTALRKEKRLVMVSSYRRHTFFLFRFNRYFYSFPSPVFSVCRIDFVFRVFAIAGKEEENNFLVF